MSVTADHLIRTLEYFAWRPSGEVPGLIQVWEDPTGRDEVLVPLDSSKNDYETLLGRAQRYITSSLGEPASRYLEMLRVTAGANLELTTWAKETSVQGGLIAWSSGEELIRAVRDSFSAAAKAAKRPKTYHGNSSHHMARAFLDKVFMGQTQIGSFVVTAHVPAAAAVPQSQSDAERLSRGERALNDPISTSAVMDRLESALSAASEGVIEYARRPTLEVFEGAVAEGLSYELASALARLSAGSESCVQIERHGDLLRPDRKAVFGFKPIHSAIFERLATQYAQDAEPSYGTLTGEVTLLSRDREANDVARVIRLNMEGPGPGPKRARIRLTPEQYEIALRAHSENRQFTVDGRIEREGRYYWLYDASNVRVGEALSQETTESPRGETLFDEDQDGA